MISSSRAVRRPALLAVALALLAPRAALSAQDSSRAPARLPAGTRIDFQDADLRAVITAIAEAGGLNVTYGEIPPRRVTLHLPQTLGRADMLPLLRSIAASNGLRVVSDGPLVRVEPLDDREAAAGRAGRVATGESGAVQLFVYRLKHARAVRLASTLRALYGAPTERGEGAGFGLSQRPLSEQLRATQIPPLVLDTLGRGAALGRPDAGTALPGGLRGEVQIVPDETTNSLLIRAQPADYETLRQAVDALDLRPLQVFIEVLIAEVRRTRAFDLGINSTLDRTAGGNETVGSVTTQTPNDVLLRITRGGSVRLDLALSALASRGDVRVLSRPVVLAENNLEARILVGSQRPFVQVFRTLPTDNGARDQIVQYRDVGTSLSLIPTINPDGYVNLQVKQEVSSATAELQFGAPVISTREATTHLFVKDAETVVIGGLADRQTERRRTGIPLLSAIPVIGGLFGGQEDSDAQSELYLFLTPHIIGSDADAARLRERAEDRLDASEARRADNPPVAPSARSPAPSTPTPPAAGPVRPPRR